MRVYSTKTLESLSFKKYKQLNLRVNYVLYTLNKENSYISDE